MLYVDGMNGIIAHIETIQWLYELLDSPEAKQFDIRRITSSCKINGANASELKSPAASV
uniref:FHOD1/3-like FH3 domain-containing protein n=1 Tax=Ascaris lumbricoides TaxID=6252 RepID=A0A0M3HIE7_ASCLU